MEGKEVRFGIVASSLFAVITTAASQSVNENSAASRAGLKAGDVIIAVDDEKIDSINALVSGLAKKEGAVSLKIIRNHAEQTITVTLEKLATPPAVRRGAIIRSVSTV